MKPPSPGISAEADYQAKLVEARQIVVEDPEILKGTPVIRGTRIPVHDIAASVSAGLSRERIREAWPTLDDRMIELASMIPFAKARVIGRERFPASLRSLVRYPQRSANLCNSLLHGLWGLCLG